MAAALALVSFSCTGPIIGTLLIHAAVSDGLLSPAVGMLVFSLALAVPFAVFSRGGDFEGCGSKHPVAVSNQPEKIAVKSGQGFSLDASGSTDPDGDNLSFLWFHYPEAGSYRKLIKLGAENLGSHWVVAPEVAKEETIHFILRVTDKGAPSLSRYKRVIVTVQPK